MKIKIEIEIDTETDEDILEEILEKIEDLKKLKDDIQIQNQKECTL